MTTAIREAAEKLHKRLSDFGWYRTVGTGNVDGRETLFVYVSLRQKRPNGEIPGEWEGFRVVVKPISTPVP